MNVVINLGVAADLNTLKNVGVYQVQNPVNGPSAGMFFVHVTSTNVGGNNTAVQKAWDLDTGTEYRRLKSSTGWKNWIEVGAGGGGGGDYDPAGTADAVMADHLAAADPHPQYLNNDRGDVRYDANGAAATAVTNHVAASDPHPQYLNQARGDVLYDPLGGADDAVSAHVATVDPHTQYFNTARGDARYDLNGAGDAAVAAHEAESDPHTQYLTNARGDARYDAIGTADAAVAAHVAATDPHTQYFNTTRGDARYQLLDSDLTAIAALTTTTFGRGLLTQADAAATRTTLGLVPGTDVQAYDADLAAIAALATQSFGRSLLTGASAAAVQATLGLVIGTNVYGPGSTDVAIADGGTGASTQAAARQAMTTPFTPGYRLTLTSGDPTMSAGGVTSATTVYYTPFAHSYLLLNISGTWTVVDGANTELSQALSDTTKSPAAATANNTYDLFLWYDAGTKRCTRGPAWSSTTVRGTGAGSTEITRNSIGVWVNANAITNGPAAGFGLYVGTIRTDGSNLIIFNPRADAVGGGNATIHIWNMYNRVEVAFADRDSGTVYTYASNTLRQCRGSTNNQIRFLRGLDEDPIYARFSCSGAGDGTANRIFIFLAFDSTTVNDTSFGTATSLQANTPSHMECGGGGYPGIGQHALVKLERVVSGGGSCSLWPADGNLSGTTRF